ncbi:asl4865 [Nostoc sp. PCC 7120 = FACHB-418]|nr:asl4865 [Nostoc sp. PCC 7120 = FACHB-418]
MIALDLCRLIQTLFLDLRLSHKIYMNSRKFTRLKTHELIILNVNYSPYLWESLYFLGLKVNQL